jgi:cellulose synthase operon protein YhjQ
MQRVVIDASTAAGTLARQIMRVATTVLVPIVPDLNSVVSITAVDNFFRQQVSADGRAIQPYYVLSQFDASLPLHMDVREVLKQQLGDRLLPIAVRRSPAVSEGLAEGMTVVDYAPNSPVTEDYLNIAAWLRNVSVPVAAPFRGTRWSER